MKTNIKKVYTWIHCGKVASYNVYYSSGIVRRFYPGKFVPENVMAFVNNSHIVYLASDIIMYHLDN